MLQNESAVIDRFVSLIGGKNFISFEELTNQLGLSTAQLIALKNAFEGRLREEDNKLRLTSKVDTDSPGFWIES